MNQDVPFSSEPSPVVCFPRKLAENITKIDSIDLHFWIYCYYYKDVNAREFKSSFNLDDIQFYKILKHLEWHKLIEFNEKSSKWVARNGNDFRF